MASATMNGIDMAKLQDTLGAIEQNPTVAHFNFRVVNEWIEGTHNRATVHTFLEGGREDRSRTLPLVFEEDEPPVLLGDNQGANPVEYVLVGLSGCLTTSLVAHAAAEGVALKSVKCQVDGDLDVRGFLGLSEDIRPGYQQIRVTFQIDSDAPRARIQQLVELAQKRSPVFDIITHAVPVRVTMADS